MLTTQLQCNVFVTFFREIFDLLGLNFNSMQFVLEKFDNRSIIDAINNGRKCPAIVGAKFDLSTSPFTIEAHVMVAAGVKIETIPHASSFRRQRISKNSYRDDPNQSGNFHH